MPALFLFGIHRKRYLRVSLFIFPLGRLFDARGALPVGLVRPLENLHFAENQAIGRGASRLA